MRFVCVAFAVGAAWSAAACTGEIGDADDGESSTSQSVVTHNRLSVNRLAVNRLAVNRLAVNRLAVNRLAVNRLEANLEAMGDLLATAEGQDLLGYILSCALPEGTVLVAEDPNTGDPLEFFGGLGLAKRWMDHPIDKKGKRWVSACLYSRVNAHDVTVPISMRGPHRGLYTTPEELASWTLQEGAFYGDYFRPLDQPIIWIACRGSGQAAGETGGLQERDCAEPDPMNPGKTLCGFTYAGNCGDYGPPNHEHACRRWSPHGYWASCQDDDRYDINNKWISSDDDDDNGDHEHDDDDDAYDKHGNCTRRASYHQVITTFAQP